MRFYIQQFPYIIYNIYIKKINALMLNSLKAMTTIYIRLSLIKYTSFFFNFKIMKLLFCIYSIN